MSRRVTTEGVQVETHGAQAARVTAAGVSVEDREGAPLARVTATGMQVEDALAEPLSRVSAVGIVVEWKPRARVGPRVQWV